MGNGAVFAGERIGRAGARKEAKVRNFIARKPGSGYLLNNLPPLADMWKGKTAANDERFCDRLAAIPDGIEARRVREKVIELIGFRNEADWAADREFREEVIKLTRNIGMTPTDRIKRAIGIISAFFGAATLLGHQFAVGLPLLFGGAGLFFETMSSTRRFVWKNIDLFIRIAREKAKGDANDP